MNYLLKYEEGALGDTLALLPFFEDFHNQYPNDNLYFSWKTSNFLWYKQRDLIFEHSKYIVKYNGEQIDKELIVTSVGDLFSIPILSRPYKIFEDAGIHVNQTIFRVPWNFLDGELESFIYTDKKPLALINAGYHPNISSKNWGVQNYQKLVDELKDKINFIQIGETIINGFNHKPLDGIYLNLLNKTTISKLAVLMYNVDFAFTNATGTNTFATIPSKNVRHVFCFCGNRESVLYDNFSGDGLDYHLMRSNMDYSKCFGPNQTACWISKIEQCKHPIFHNNETVASCLYDISVNDIVSTVNRILIDK